jgi:hypothetical protein
VNRKWAVLVFLVIIGAFIIHYQIFSNSSQVQFYYEDNLPETWIRGSNLQLYCNNLHDTNVTISFQNNRDLWYSIDITLYEPSHPSKAFLWRTQKIGIVELDAFQRVESIVIVLGTGGYYDLFLNGENVNASVTYSNEVFLANSTDDDSTGTFLFCATGKLYFALNENVDCSEGGLDVIVGSRSICGTWLYPDEVYLDIDVPDGLCGSLSIYDPTVQCFSENIGWYYRGNFTNSDSGDTYHRYATHNSRYFYQPYYLNFQEVRASTVYARLKT